MEVGSLPQKVSWKNGQQHKIRFLGRQRAWVVVSESMIRNPVANENHSNELLSFMEETIGPSSLEMTEESINDPVSNSKEGVATLNC